MEQTMTQITFFNQIAAPGLTVGAKIMLKNGKEVTIGENGTDCKASTALLTRHVASIKLSQIKQTDLSRSTKLTYIDETGTDIATQTICL